MRFLITAALVAALSACTQAPATAENAEAEMKEITATVERVVREFSEDPKARVKIEKVNDIIACGTVSTHGETKRFSVDLVDEEAFFAEDGEVNGALVNMAC